MIQRFKKCEICQLNKNSNLINTEYQLIEASEPFEILEIDHVVVNVPSNNGFNYILVSTDKFSKKSWFLPAKTMNAKETYSLLFQHVFPNFSFQSIFTPI